jgi:hypothetical protein
VSRLFGWILRVFAVLESGQLLRHGGEVALLQRLEPSVWLVVTTAGGASLNYAATALGDGSTDWRLILRTGEAVWTRAHHLRLSH